MKILPCLLLLAAGLAGCAPRAALMTGNYEETHGPGVIMFVSKQLRLWPSQKFEYFVYSDDISSGRYGAGTYQLRGRQLRLTFDGQPLGPAAASAQVRPLPAGPDSLTLTVQVQALAYRGGPAPLPGATVLACDAVGRVLAGRSTDPAGRATLHFARNRPPQVLKISSVGLQFFEQPIAGTDAAYEVQMPTDLGALYAAGTVIQFQVVCQTADRLVLRRGSNTTTLALGPPAASRSR